MSAAYDMPGVPAQVWPQQAILCTDCGKEVYFYSRVGFCRLCGGPLCADCAKNTKNYSESREVGAEYYILYRQFTRKMITTGVVLCKSCYGKYTKSAARRKLFAISGLLSLLFVFLPAFAMVGMLDTRMFCLSTGLAGAVILLSVAALDNEKKEEIRPLCPVCGTDAMPFLFVQAQNMPPNAQQEPDIIKCVCGYYGPRAPLDGLSKFVDAHGPTPLDGTPLQNAAHHSWYARRMFRKF